LLRDLPDAGSALAIVSHDLNLVAGLCHRIAVLYAGRIVELGRVEDVFHRPAHPYTRCLLQATPGGKTPPGEPLYTIPGQPPDPARLPAGCAFHPRCPDATEKCRQSDPVLVEKGGGHWSACPLIELRR
jgi:oligopeptide/dipeptide ABC transporter ATP-binding protein